MKRIKHYVKEILYFIVIMTILANAISLYKSQDLTKKPLEIDRFQLINGSTYSALKQKPLLIHFWATWCPTCKLEASNIDFLSQYFEVITVVVKSGSNEKVQNYLKEHGYKFKVVNDENGILASQFNIAGYPTTFIYDEDKKLRFSEVGYTSTPGLYLRMLWAGY